MSLFDYEVGREISTKDPPFNALIQAAMRKADTINTEKLIAAYPEIWMELNLRYNAPGGIIPSDEHPQGIKIVEVKP